MFFDSTKHAGVVAAIAVAVLCSIAERAAGQVGACCMPDGTCTIIDGPSCVFANGQFLGAGSTCDQIGACCINGMCTASMTTSQCCMNGGVFLGVGVECGGVAACCLPSGSCAQMSKACCEQQFGCFVGVGVQCSDTGACCLPGGVCEMRTVAACCADGMFAGPNTDCALVECQHLPIDMTLDQGSDLQVFNKFNEMGGSRLLQRVVVQSSVTTFHGIQYLLKDEHQTCLSESETEANFFIFLSGEFLNAAPLQPLSPIFRRSVGFPPGGPDRPRYCEDADPNDNIVLCPINPPICIPPPNCPFTCDYNGTFSYLGCYAAIVTDPTGLNGFKVVGGNNTFMLALLGNGIFFAPGSEFVFSNTLNHAEGDTFVAYVFAPTGACCLPDGMCVSQVVEADCDLDNGTWFEGQDCGPVGACCLPTGACLDTTEICCGALGGTYLGGMCLLDNGACCLPGGTCMVMNETCCIAQNGTFKGDGEICGPTGACCLTNGTCTTMQEICCDNLGGTFIGGACSPNNGACCLPDGTCAVMNLTCCTQRGGTFQGNGTTCGPTGACCLTNGTCIAIPQNCCDDQGGAFIGGPCLPSGACCLPNSECINASETCCTAQGGQFVGGTCGPTGACCLPSETCVVTSQLCCTNQGGVFQGNGTPCGPVGACCLANGSCIQIEQACCTLQGGTFVGGGVDCGETGACCLPDGSCDVIDEACCVLAGGTYAGNGVLCGPSGACCMPDGSCSIQIDVCCALMGGAFAGNNTQCGTTGACCLIDGSCQDNVFDTCCTLMGGAPFPGVTCDDIGDCPVFKGGCNEKGSLLIFSKVEIRWTDGGVLLQDTFLQLTNDYPVNVAMKMYFINGDPPLAADPTTGERAHPGWNWIDNGFTLTGDQPIYWSALSGQGASGIFDPVMSPFTVLDPGLPPGRPDPEFPGERMLRGYIIAWAVHPTTSEEIRWNHLAGVATLVHYGNAAAWQYRVCGFPVVANVPNGAVTGLSPGQLRLDGVEYRAAAAQQLMNFQAVGASAFSSTRLVVSDTDLTVHAVTADLRQETTGPVTTKVDISVWNQNEAKAGTHLCITCWNQGLLSNFPPVNIFTLAALQTNFGKARLDGVASALCDVDVTGDGVPDVVSRHAAITGLIAHYLNFDAGAEFAVEGTNLFDLGAESAVILYDLQAPPDELGVPRTKAEIEQYIDRILRGEN